MEEALAPPLPGGLTTPVVDIGPAPLTAPAGGIERLVRLASGCESPRAVLAAGRVVLGRSLALVDGNGTLLAASPPADARLVGIAQRAGRRPDDIPPGWRIRRVPGGAATDAWLLVSMEDDPAGPLATEWLDVLCALLSGLLDRMTLHRAVLEQRRAFLKHRMITDPALREDELQAEAHAAELQVARAYWPALVVGRRGEVPQAALAGLSDSWRQIAGPASFAVSWDGAVALLHARDRAGIDGVGEVDRAVRALLESAGPAVPQGLCALVADQAAMLESLHVQMRLLRRLRHLARPDLSHGAVLHVRNFALDRLLRSIDGACAEGFVRQHLGRLIEADADGEDLAHTLELALEHPRRDDAAKAGYMHRNTFRRRLNRALRLVDVELDDPEQRLGLHLALKLYRLSSTTGAGRF